MGAGPYLRWISPDDVGLGEVRDARFSRNDGYPQGGGVPKVFLLISSRTFVVNEPYFPLAARRRASSGAATIPSVFRIGIMPAFQEIFMLKKPSGIFFCFPDGLENPFCRRDGPERDGPVCGGMSCPSPAGVRNGDGRMLTGPVEGSAEGRSPSGNPETFRQRPRFPF